MPRWELPLLARIFPPITDSYCREKESERALLKDLVSLTTSVGPTLQSATQTADIGSGRAEDGEEEEEEDEGEEWHWSIFKLNSPRRECFFPHRRSTFCGVSTCSPGITQPEKKGTEIFKFRCGGNFEIAKEREGEINPPPPCSLCVDFLALLSYSARHCCQSERERLCHRVCGDGGCGGGGAPRAAAAVDQFHEPAIKLGVGERAKKSRDPF